MAKIRNGFVSNSSSSSFMIFLPRNDKTINDMGEFEKWLVDEYDVDNEEMMKYFIKEYEGVIKSNIDKGNGFIVMEIDDNCYDSINDIAEAIG